MLACMLPGILVLLSLHGASGAVTSQTITFHSNALDQQTTYIALLPGNLQAGHRYPVLYLLHGAYGSYADWTSNTPITNEMDGRPFIVVMPDGGQFGWYLDSMLKPGSKYESFITQDLLADVEKRFPADTERKARAIAGLSMGGHGALSLAAKYTELYGSASSMSGILRLSLHPKDWKIGELLGELPEAYDLWEQSSVYGLAEQFASADVALLFDTGTSDSAGAVKDNRQVHERMSNRGIRHTYREYPGNHNWKYWSTHIGEHLEFHQKHFANRTPRITGVKDSPKGDMYTSRTLAFEKENEQKWKTGGRPIVLLGSSTFHKIKEAELFPGLPIANRGIGGDRVGLDGFRGILHRLYCSVFECRAKAVFINNGTNDLTQTARHGTPTVEKVADGYAEIVRRIRQESPDAKVFIVSCTPTRDAHAATSPLIAKYNDLIRKLAESGDTHVRYVDTYTPVVGPDGLLRQEYSADGLHLNDAGYALLKERFLQAMNEAGM